MNRQEDQIFPQLPEFERDAIICQKLYPDKESGEISEQELSEIKKLCKEASATVFIVDSNNASDLLCMKYLAEYFSQHSADFMVIVCGVTKTQYYNGSVGYICQKANGVYLIEDNYTYWHLAIYLCTVINAFILHTKSPDVTPEMFDNLRTIFPRQSNLVLDIIGTSSREDSKTTVIDKFLANEENVQKIMSGHTGYCLITPTKSQSEEDLKSLHVTLSKYNEHSMPFLTIFRRGGETDVSTMFMVITKKADLLFK